MTQGELASLLKSMGCTGAALDIYQRLQLWEEVILCYQLMGKREKVWDFQVLLFFTNLLSPLPCHWIWWHRGSTGHLTTSAAVVEGYSLLPAHGQEKRYGIFKCYYYCKKFNCTLFLTVILNLKVTLHRMPLYIRIIIYHSLYYVLFKKYLLCNF